MSAHPAANAADIERVAELLGRAPECDFTVVVRDDDDDPVVIRNAPFLRSGRPMPTVYYLVGAAISRDVGQLEAEGGVRRAEAAVDADLIDAAHRASETERDAAIPDDYEGPRPSGGVGGTRTGVKCLHAHVAQVLATGDDAVGQWTLDLIGWERAEAGLARRIVSAEHAETPDDHS